MDINNKVLNFLSPAIKTCIGPRLKYCLERGTKLELQQGKQETYLGLGAYVNEFEVNKFNIDQNLVERVVSLSF